MRTILSALVIVGFTGAATAQTGGGGSGSNSGGGGTSSPSTAPRSTSPTVPSTTPPSNAPSTPSQRNLDLAPPTRNLPDSQGNAVTPQPPQKGAAPGSVPPQDNQVPPASGGNARVEPGGANSSPASRQNQTGKNALSESYTTCLNIWDAGTHMSKTEWARAYKRVENRLDVLQRQLSSRTSGCASHGCLQGNSGKRKGASRRVTAVSADTSTGEAGVPVHAPTNAPPRYPT